MNQKDLDRLLDSVEDRFRQTALAIKSGKIERKPLKRHNNAIGCDFCDYRSICRMDSGGACRPYRYHEFEFATENTQKTEVTDDE